MPAGIRLTRGSIRADCETIGRESIGPITASRPFAWLEVDQGDCSVVTTPLSVPTVRATRGAEPPPLFRSVIRSERAQRRDRGICREGVKRVLCLALLLVLLLTSLITVSCSSRNEVVIYTSRDQLYAEPVLEAFERETGIRVRAVYDTGATKTVGLTSRLLAEKEHPQADVFWNSEVVRTIVLQRAGVLAPYRSAEAAAIPARYKDPEGYWTGFGARARVILANREQVAEGEAPDSLFDLVAPRWRGQVALGNPILGTMATHHAALFVVLGDEEARVFFQSLVANEVQIVTGNTAVRDAVSRGELPVGIIDTSDAHEAIADGAPVEIVYPDQEGMGTLVIPNTVALIAGGPHPENGKRLVDYLLRAETERVLAWSRSAQIPLHPGLDIPPHVRPIDRITDYEVDFGVVADRLDEVNTYLSELLIR
jgi:iron(III) transport system substrate-binding protein